eukprot:77861-Prymnesium_polylepis.1
MLFRSTLQNEEHFLSAVFVTSSLLLRYVGVKIVESLSAVPRRRGNRRNFPDCDRHQASVTSPNIIARQLGGRGTSLSDIRR